MSVEDRTRATLLAAAHGIDPDTDAMFANVETAIHRHTVRRRALLGVAAVVAVVGVVFGSSVLGTWPNDQDIAPAGPPASDDNTILPGTDPAAVIEAYVSAYNAEDIDAVMALFTEDSTIVGHPTLSDAVGLDAIRLLTIEDRQMAAEADPYAISNVQTDGDTVTWDHTWTNDAGEDWCQEGLSAVISDGTIVSWAFAEPELCN